MRPFYFHGMILKSPLEICSSAVVRKNEASVAEKLSLISNPSEFIETLKVDLNCPELLKWRQEPRLRRASPISIFMAQAVKQLLETYSVDVSSCGLIASFSTGALTYSGKFYQEMLTQGTRFASPILFPETVFNSPTSHVAAIFKIGGPCYSIIGDQSAWVSALSTAECWLSSDQASHVLVLGAEELDVLMLEAAKKAGWLRKESRYLPSEGCGALLLRKSQSSSLPKLLGISEGFTYRKRRDVVRAAQESVSCFSKDYKILKTSRQNWLQPMEDRLHRELGFDSVDLKMDHGEAFTASAAWNTIQGLQWVNENAKSLVVPIWGVNYQCSALLLGAA
jgi:hypothetical protein